MSASLRVCRCTSLGRVSGSYLHISLVAPFAPNMVYVCRLYVHSFSTPYSRFCCVCLLEMADTDNPFAGDPERHPALIVHTAQPFNAEPPAALLVDSPTTPNDIFYVRNHLPVPHVDVDAYCVNVEGPTPASFAMDQLKESFAHVRTFMGEENSKRDS